MDNKIKTGIIYQALNKATNKSYIGQTVKTLKARKWRHVNDSKKYPNIYFYRALKKYKNWDWNIVCKIEANTKTLVKEYLNLMEQVYIKQFNAFDSKHGYNLTKGGDGRLGFSHSVSKETRYKISIANKGKTGYWKGKKRSEETKQKISATKKGTVPWMKGRHHTEATKQKLRELNKGHVPWNKGGSIPLQQIEKLRKLRLGMHLSDETKKKISEGNKGKVGYWKNKKMPEYVKKKISNSNKGQIPWIKGRHHTNTTKKLMSEAHKGCIPWNKGKYLSEETRKKMSKSRKKIAFTYGGNTGK